MTAARRLRFLVPDGIHDPTRVSGGNVYDRLLHEGLSARGWTVTMVPVSDAAAVAAAVITFDDGAIVLVDGLVAGWAPDALEHASTRTRIVVLAHMVGAAFPGTPPDLVDAEIRVLRAAERIIATSEWAAEQLTSRDLVARERVAVATPGSREGTLLPGADHRSLLCVGALAPHKGQDVLLAALGLLEAERWTCRLVGSTTVDLEYAARISAAASRWDGRASLSGILHGAALERAYRHAGLLVAPSRSESYGMAVVDARRRGLPIIASAVGGLPEAAGTAAVLVPSDDPRALAEAIGRWLSDASFRSAIRRAAEQGRADAPRWSQTVDSVDRLLESV